MSRLAPGAWAGLMAAIMVGSDSPSDPVARQGRGAPAPISGYRVVRTYPHDRQAFTQGLIYRSGVFYESTGLHGQSSLRKVRLDDGAVLQKRAVDPQYFAEGLTEWDGRLIQLTWRSTLGFVYDRGTFSLLRTFGYQGEGWGLTHDAQRLIMSDGSATLRFIDPATFKELSRLTVKDAGVPVSNLNELEFVGGEIYANVWQTDRIARIAPTNGRVLGWIDLQGLLTPRERAGTDVLNGIAYDAQGRRLFVTGKLWPTVFEIEITPPR